MVENNVEHETYDPVDNENQDNIIFKDNTTSINDNYNEIKTITEEERDLIGASIDRVRSGATREDLLSDGVDEKTVEFVLKYA